MAIVDFDIIQVKAIGVIGNESMQNVYYYTAVVNGSGQTLSAVLDGWILQVLEEIATFQSEGAHWSNVSAYNLTNGLDFAIASISLDGAIAEPMISPFAAFGFRLNRLTTVTRNGYKRIGGVAESYYTDGVSNSSAIERAAFEGILDADVLVEDGGNSVELTQVIVGRNPDGSHDLERINIVQSVSFNQYLTTQNTRKVGRGQ